MFTNNSDTTIVFDKCLAPNITVNGEFTIFLEVYNLGDKKISPPITKSLSNINGDINNDCETFLLSKMSTNITFDLLKEYELNDLLGKMHETDDVYISLYVSFRFESEGELNHRLIFKEWKFDKQFCSFIEMIK
jgi:hypothetical protein